MTATQETYVASYDNARTKLRWGIITTWALNINLLTLVFLSAVMIATVRRDTPTETIINIIKHSLIPCALLAIVLVLVVSMFSWKAITLMAGAHLKEVTPDTKNMHHKQIFNIVEEVHIASGSKLPMPRVYIDNSDVMNAYALSTPRGSQIVFTQQLIDTLNREELTGVAAHEWGHILAGDSKAMTKLIAIASITSLVASLFTQFIPTNKSGDGKNNPIAIVVLVVSFIFLLLSPMVSHVAQMFMSRQRESQADVISVELTKNPTALASALQKISSHSGVETDEKERFEKSVGQLAFFSHLVSTHPPVEKRLKALRELGAQV